MKRTLYLSAFYGLHEKVEVHLFNEVKWIVKVSMSGFGFSELYPVRFFSFSFFSVVIGRPVRPKTKYPVRMVTTKSSLKEQHILFCGTQEKRREGEVEEYLRICAAHFQKRRRWSCVILREYETFISQSPTDRRRSVDVLFWIFCNICFLNMIG